MNAEQLANLYMTYLKEEGYHPSLDSDGDVRFKAEGFSYYIKVEADDLQYFRLVFPNFWPIDSPGERARVYIATDYVHQNCKVIKIYQNKMNTQVSAAVECLLSEPGQFRAIFARALNVIRYGVKVFAEQI